MDAGSPRLAAAFALLLFIATAAAAPPLLHLDSEDKLAAACRPDGQPRPLCVLAVLPSAERQDHLARLQQLAKAYPAVGFLWMEEGAELGVEYALGGPFDGGALLAYSPADARVFQLDDEEEGCVCFFGAGVLLLMGRRSLRLTDKTGTNAQNYKNKNNQHQHQQPANQQQECGQLRAACQRVCAASGRWRGAVQTPEAADAHSQGVPTRMHQQHDRCGGVGRWRNGAAAAGVIRRRR